jgi:murein DD-endopeptidase MepM/ murein hydrolase activator NlpD
MVTLVRTKLPHVLAASAAACLLLQVPVAASPDAGLEHRRQQVEQRSESLRDRLESARGELARTRRRQADTRSTLQELDARQTELADRLAELQAELEVAEASLREAEQALRTTHAKIDATTAELGVTRRALRDREQLLKARARASYMHGRVGYAEAVLDIDTANELGTSLQYMRNMISDDRDKVEQISTLQRRYEGMLVTLGELQAAQDDAREQRETDRDKVAGLVAQKRELDQQLAEQEQEHQALLAELNSDAEDYRAAIDEMEARSQSIQARLADIASEQRAKQRSSSGGGSSSAGMQWPVNGPITSGFGYRTHPVLGYQRLHAGTDFGAGTGSPIVAAASGTVISAGWTGGYGNATIIAHGSGLATLYGHQSRLAVWAGTRVSKGQVIGYVGSTGMSTGPHLHFEVRRFGVPVDAVPYLR